MRKNTPGKNGGFTIMEVIVAMALVAIAGLSFLFMQNTTWYKTKTSNKLMNAGLIIEQEIESIRIEIAKDPDANWITFTGTDGDSYDKDGFTITRKIEDAFSPVDGSGPLTNVRQLTLTVSWGTGTDDELEVVTNIARNF